MGANTHLETQKFLGYKQTATTGVAVVYNVDPVKGYRPVVYSLGLTAGTSFADKLYVMTPIGRTTVDGEVASGLGTVVLAADPGPDGTGLLATNIFASNDLVCIELSDGKYQYFSATNWVVGTLTLTLSENLKAKVNDGAMVWNFGIYSDPGHYRLTLTAGDTQTTKDAAEGLFGGTAPGDPLKLWLQPSASASQKGNFDYVKIGYVNA